MSLKSQRDYWLIFRYIIWISVFLLFLLLFFLWRIDNYRVERFRLAILNYTIPNVEFFTSSVKVIGRIFLDISSFTNVYEQNKNDLNYNKMSEDFENSLAFSAACYLIFKGRIQPSGYT